MKKLLSGLSLAVTAAVILTGCSSLTYTQEQAEDVTYSTIQDAPATLTHAPSFSYVNTDGQLEKLEECVHPNLFGPYNCENEAGTVVFEFQLSKHQRVVNAHITVDGDTMTMVCKSVEGVSYKVTNVCIPQ